MNTGSRRASLLAAILLLTAAAATHAEIDVWECDGHQHNGPHTHSGNGPPVTSSDGSCHGTNGDRSYPGKPCITDGGLLGSETSIMCAISPKGQNTWCSATLRCPDGKTETCAAVAHSGTNMSVRGNGREIRCFLDAFTGPDGTSYPPADVTHSCGTLT